MVCNKTAASKDDSVSSDGQSKIGYIKGNSEIYAGVHVKEERKMTETVSTALASKPIPQREVQSKT